MKQSPKSRELFLSLLTLEKEKPTVERLFGAVDKKGYSPFLRLVQACTKLNPPNLPYRLNKVYVFPEIFRRFLKIFGAFWSFLEIFGDFWSF
jgi:hypothetical protein